MFTDISAQRVVTLAQTLGSGPFRLLMLLSGMSKDGTNAIYPTGQWCAETLGISLSSYHRYRRTLETELGPLLRIIRRKIAIRRNLPNVVHVPSLRLLARWAWERMQGLRPAAWQTAVRKGVRSGTETPSLYITNVSLTPKLQKYPWMQSEIYRRMVAKGLGKSGGTT
jgi:hypothetical protein